MKSEDADKKAALGNFRFRRDAVSVVQYFPYGEALRSVMVSPVYTCSPNDNVRDVVRAMSTRSISCAVVVGSEGEPVGIVTERDVLRKIAASECEQMVETRISSIMTSGPYVLGPDDSIFRALSVLSSRGIKHLPLVEDGLVAGIVTLRQLMRLKDPEPMMLIDDIAAARDARDLAEIKAQISSLAELKLGHRVRASAIVAMISEINQDIHRKAMELAMNKLGDPPVEFCLFVSGSHGRMENLLTSDQDHGIIISDMTAYDTRFDEYFMELGRMFSESLVDIGFPWCPGYIMSMNPTWRKSLSEWKVQLEYWFERQVLNLTRYVTVFFDSRPVYGDENLFHLLSDHAFELLGRHHEVLRILMDEESSHRVPLGFMGRFITEKTEEHYGEIDIKRSGLIFMVEAIRILSLLKGVRETSTLGRISALVEGGHLNPNDAEYFDISYRTFLRYALSSQLEKSSAGLKPDTYITLRTLTKHDRESLRQAFRSVASLKDIVSSEFGQLVI
jgi:CBS domain-containing protein